MTHSTSLNLRRAAERRSKNKLIWGCLFLSVGVALLTLGAWSAAQGSVTSSWPRASATLVDFKVSVSQDTDPHGQDPLFQSNHNSIYLTIKYAYRFEGGDYSSAGIQRGAFGSQNAALSRKLARSLSNGAKVSVAVNPADPNEAYLVPGVSGIAYLLAGGGLAITLIGLAILRGPPSRSARNSGRAAMASSPLEVMSLPGREPGKTTH